MILNILIFSWSENENKYHKKQPRRNPGNFIVENLENFEKEEKKKMRKKKNQKERVNKRKE